MLSLTFVMPHWLYWSTLALYPLVALFLVRWEQGRSGAGRPNLFLAYLFLATAGFLGMHRFYLKSAWGLIFIPFFLAVLWSGAQVHDAREMVSSTRSSVEQADRLVKRAHSDVDRRRAGAADQLVQAEAKLVATHTALSAAAAQTKRVNAYASVAGILLGLVLLGDAFLVPGLVRRARSREIQPTPAIVIQMGADISSTPPMPVWPLRAIDWLTRIVGEFVSYWAVLAVFAYYYEVVARYVFNSPTNWVHESMFLMFGMQYMLAGAYAYRDETHVRVDIIYSRLSARGRAVCDIITSLFFFLFAATLLVTGWRFASDAISVGEHSFTEWGIQYWPVKLAIPVGAALLLLQGFARLLRDIATIVRRVD